MWARLLDILLNYDFEFAELEGGVLSLIWGVWMLLPISADWYSAFDILIQIAPGTVWATAFITIGAAQLYGVATRSYQVRRHATFFSLLLWLCTSLLVALIDWHIPTVPLTMAFSFGAAWGYVRIGKLHAPASQAWLMRNPDTGGSLNASSNSRG